MAKSYPVYKDFPIMEELRVAREWIMNNPMLFNEPLYIKISIWQAIKFKLKGFKVRLIK